jgi:hypothetical protein
MILYVIQPPSSRHIGMEGGFFNMNRHTPRAADQYELRAVVRGAEWNSPCKVHVRKIRLLPSTRTSGVG